MTQNIQLPGGVTLRDPSPDTKYVLQQLQQVTMGLNTLAGQLDMLIRLQAGAITAEEVVEKYKAFDAQVEANNGESAASEGN